MVVALSGYFLIGDRRGDIMDYTLDMLGTRLIELAASDGEKDEIARQFAEFSGRIERDEVSPEVVETVAANVLNLKARGAVVTPEDVELMLFQEPGSALPYPSDSVSGIKPYVIAAPATAGASFEMRELPERLATMFEIADAARDRGDASRPPVRFSRDESGVHVIIDSDVAETIAIDTREFEGRGWIRWQDDLSEREARRAAAFREQANRLAEAESARAAGFERQYMDRLQTVKRIQKLAELGATTDLDTLGLYRELDLLFRDIEVDIQASMQGLAEGLSASGVSVSVQARPDSTRR